MSLKDFHDKTLYLIEILHQTTTLARPALFPPGCILSKFYIKPQHRSSHNIGQLVVSYRNSTSNHNRAGAKALRGPVVSYRNSTSNHNAGTTTPNSALLYLIEILHQTTTTFSIIQFVPRCILSKFYIKPQRSLRSPWICRVVSYRNSTSNHNTGRFKRFNLPVVSYRNSTSNHN